MQFQIQVFLSRNYIHKDFEWFIFIQMSKANLIKLFPESLEPVPQLWASEGDGREAHSGGEFEDVPADALDCVHHCVPR